MMGANRRNKYLESRRFAPCYKLADDPVYLALFDEYQKSKPPHAQNTKPMHITSEQHDRHVENIRKIRDYVKGAHKP